MPTSGFAVYEYVARVMARYDPHSVLEIGSGFGLHGAIVRGVLDVYRDGVIPGSSWTRKLDAIDPAVYEPLPVYDTRIRELAQDALPKMAALSYDMILAMFVLEHMSKSEGIAVLRECLRVGRMVFVGCPDDDAMHRSGVWDDQIYHYDNPFALHRSLWLPEDVSACGGTIRLLWHVPRDRAWLIVCDAGYGLSPRSDWEDHWPPAEYLIADKEHL